MSCVQQLGLVQVSCAYGFRSQSAVLKHTKESMRNRKGRIRHRGGDVSYRGYPELMSQIHASFEGRGENGPLEVR